MSFASIQLLLPLAAASAPAHLPRDLSSYAAAPGGNSLPEVLVSRIQEEPFNLVATGIFFMAILHTFATARFRHWAHEADLAHRARHGIGGDSDGRVSFKAQMLHFFGEVEAVFGIWALVLVGAITVMKGWGAARDYLGHHVNFTEPMFVVVIMALASTRPVLQFAERGLRAVASAGRGSVAAWWLTILIVAPLLGSFITEPAAMTIGAILLGRQFYELRPRARFAYATLGLLFANVSVGGTLTHFAAPPVLMVADPWGWNITHMLTHFGWRALVGIVAASFFYFWIFKKHFRELQARRDARAGAITGADAGADADGAAEAPGDRVPLWISCVHVGFMAWTVFVAHYPPLFIGGFLFFVAFSQATSHHQGKLDLKQPILVGFFLAGLVIHGGLQGWWIAPVLSRLQEAPLFLSAVGLTAFNDNAAITYLATLVPDFGEQLKYAVVAGAVTGGGLTVIANAPNPAGQSLLAHYFEHGVSPLGLFLGALIPTTILAAAFMLL